MSAVSGAPVSRKDGHPIVAGTDFVAEDTTERGRTNSVIIGDALARALFPGTSAIGRRLVPVGRFRFARNTATGAGLRGVAVRTTTIRVSGTMVTCDGSRERRARSMLHDSHAGKAAP